MVENIHESKFRKIGFTVSFLLLVGILVISLFMARDLIRGPHLLQVSFENVGTLIPQEAVSMDGVEVGQVRKIEYSPKHALVTLEFYKRITLPRDSRIVNFNHSLMGARMVFIFRGDSKEEMDFSQIQIGRFEEGIAEMLHKTVEVLYMVQEYKALAERLEKGTDSSASVVELFNQKLLPVIQTYREQLKSVAGMEADIARHIRQIEKVTQNFRRIVKITGANSEKITGTTQVYLSQVDTLLSDVNKVVAETGAFLDYLRRGDNPVHDIIYKRTLFEKVEALNHSLNQVVVLLKAEGITDMISFWKNVHILGANPTKKQHLLK